MAKPLVSDALWQEVEWLLPAAPPRPRGGRPRLSDRAVLTGIVFVLRIGTPWELLPPEMGCGSGMTCWRRLRDWHQAGVWAALHRVLLQRPADADRLDWSRACLDSCSVPAPKGVKRAGPSPFERGRPGTKRHLVVERGGPPLAAVLSAANVHDSKMLGPRQAIQSALTTFEQHRLPEARAGGGIPEMEPGLRR